MREQPARRSGTGCWLVRRCYLTLLDLIGMPTHDCAAVLPPPIAATYVAVVSRSVVIAWTVVVVSGTIPR